MLYNNDMSNNELSYQLIVSTMNQNNIGDLCKRMNINSDAIIINQCGKYEYSEITLAGGVF